MILFKKSLIKIFPAYILNFYRALKSKPLIAQMKKLPIDSMGVDSTGVPWVRLKNNLIFYGFKPDSRQRLIYHLYKSDIPHIKEECFDVVDEIISRYEVPRSIPGETAFNPSSYQKLRDPINDLQISKADKLLIAKKFQISLGDIVVDVGAYLGYGTMKIAQRVGPTGKVIAFEPDPDVCYLLKRNIIENGLTNVIIIPKAASSEPGDCTLYRKINTDSNSLDESVLETLGYEGLKQITVEVTTIDETLSSLSIDSVNSVNITINGHEREALLGMKNTLNNSSDVSLTLAGWYIKDNHRICDVVKPDLENMGFNLRVGKLGRVLAWKNKSNK